MIKYTNTIQKKLETILDELEYVVRFEKGNFKSGYCLLESKNIVVVNKYFDSNAKCNALIMIIEELIQTSDKDLTKVSFKFWSKIQKDHALAKKEADED